jgi:hypothetical protein
MQDTDKVLEVFFSECASAGPEGCHFYAPTAHAVSQRLMALYESIRAQPVVVHTTSYGIVDYSLLRRVIFTSLYLPYTLFPILAKALSDLEAGDGTTLFELVAHQNFECHCDEKSAPFYDNSFEAQTAIMCSDAQEVHDSPQELHTYYEDLVKVSSWAELLGSIRIRCSWVHLFGVQPTNDLTLPCSEDGVFEQKITLQVLCMTPKTQVIGLTLMICVMYTGPFVANTSHPILLIGNTAGIYILDLFCNSDAYRILMQIL